MNGRLLIDRTEAGQILAEKLRAYKGKDVVVYAIPRGGVVTGVEIAKRLHAPLDLLITRKISHPDNPEYAIAATTENGLFVGNKRVLLKIDQKWLEEAIIKQREEAARRRKRYLRGRKLISPEKKIAILVDDGVATGLTLQAAIEELKNLHPLKLIVAVPVIPVSTVKRFEAEVDKVVALITPQDRDFLGAVGAYYNDFSQIEDEKVIEILKKHSN